MPKFVLSLNSPELIDQLEGLEPEWALLGAAGLSRRGRLGEGDLERLLEVCGKRGVKVALLWDLPVNDDQLLADVRRIEPWVGRLDALRVTDPGAAAWAKRHWPDLPLQFSLESHGVNDRSLRAWARLLEPERLVLSNQLPVRSLRRLDLTGLPLLEMQALGPLEVFFSSRALLEAESEWARLEAVSRERPRQVYALEQGPRGTVMLHSRELFLLDHTETFAAAGIDQIRLEFSSGQAWAAFEAHRGDWARLKRHWPSKVTRGFFSANRTDRPLARLTNRHLARAEGRVLGQVLQAKKGAYCLIELHEALELPQEVRVATPEGGEFFWSLESLKTPSGQPVGPKVEPGVYLLPHQKGALARSLLLL